MRRRTMWWVVALVLASACAKEAKVQPPGRRAVRVVVVGESASAGGDRRYAATLQPRLQVELPFKVGGRVTALGETREGGRTRPLQAGDHVVAGQILARLDPSDLRRNEGAARAALQSARAQARAAHGALAQAERERNRARTLAASDTIARADLDRAEAAYAAALANRDAAEGQRQARHEQHAQARAALEDAGLKSPLPGVIARRMVEVGELAAPGKPAFVLVDTTQLKVVFGVPDTRVNALRDGQRVPVGVDALPGRTFEGRVTRIDPLADAALRSFTVEVTLDNADGALRAGMVADVELVTGEGDRNLRVPLAAVLRARDRPDGFAVQRLRDDGTVALTPVELGDLDGNQVRVEAGLTAGMKIVTDGAQFLHEGEQVQVVP